MTTASALLQERPRDDTGTTEISQKGAARGLHCSVGTVGGEQVS